MKNFIFELFPSYLPINSDSNHFVEVFNLSGCEYGSIFYKGNLIATFSGENYATKLNEFNKSKMKELGLDLNKAKVLFYDVEIIEPQHYKILPNLDKSDSLYSNYTELLKSIRLDFLPLQSIIQVKEAQYAKDFPTAKWKFLQLHELD